MATKKKHIQEHGNSTIWFYVILNLMVGFPLKSLYFLEVFSMFFKNQANFLRLLICRFFEALSFIFRNLKWKSMYSFGNNIFCLIRKYLLGQNISSSTKMKATNLSSVNQSLKIQENIQLSCLEFHQLLIFKQMVSSFYQFNKFYLTVLRSYSGFLFGRG